MRAKIFGSILMFSMIALLAGLAYTQMGMHERYKVMSEENRLKIVPLMAPRGSIFDRHERVLAGDILSFKISVIHNRIRNVDSLIDVLSPALGISKETLSKNIRKSGKQPYSPVCLAREVEIEKAIQIEEITMDYPEILFEVSAKREYMYGSTGSSVLGYLGSINRSEFNRLKHYGYKINDVVGRDGVEKYYDEYLRGKHGGKQIEVDHRGREVAILGFKEPVSGKGLHLTIDVELQGFCDSLLIDKRGAIIVIDPATGAIFAMASAPGYDPGVFDDPSRVGELKKVLNNSEYPLLNRAVSGSYPPGSVFKPVVALAALEEKKITPNTTFECPGHFTLGDTTFHCWLEKGHGTQDMRSAIKNSCNVYFFNIGLRVTAEKIFSFAKKWGLGCDTGIDLPNENPGVLPGRFWKRKKFNENWYKGDTVNSAIGQGYVLCSPLQIARMMCVFANNGYLIKPYIVEKAGGVFINSAQKVKLEITQKNLEEVRMALKAVVNDVRGTGAKARLDSVVISGKTGTAQTSKGRSHGWFAGFAPFENAKVVVVVFDEYGGKGGYYAAQTAGKVFQKACEMGIL
ncbi:MAG: penicillin-binding protein 2 [Candidatus Omnitrophota bacterium]